MALKKVKLNYMSATTHTELKAKIKVSSAKMEELDRSIKEKTRQNNSDFNVGRDNLKDNIYYSNKKIIHKYFSRRIACYFQYFLFL